MIKQVLVSFVVTVTSISFSFAQNTSLPSSLSGPQSESSQDSGQSLADMARRVRKDHSEETKLTDEDAKKLFETVDRISAFASQDSALPLHGPVKRRIIGPDEVEKSAREHLGRKEYSDEFERSELTMKKFGLMPRDFDLKEFIVKVRRKDVAGYYDDETKTISLLNTVPLEEQEAVLAHELTHALQDQNYDLKSWMKAGDLPAGKNVGDGDSGEHSSARRAVVEGQAMIVFGDYILAPSGRNLLTSPGFIYRLEDPSIKAAPDTEMLHQAPIIVRATGTFPYHEGLIFEGELLQAGGRKMAFAGVFANPPRNTHEIIQPRAYLERQKPAFVPVPDAKALLGGSYELFDSGSMGELDVRALLWQLGTRTLADDLSKSWQGGAYMVFRNKGANATSAADLKLLYISRWNSELAAQRFAKFYADSVPRRYQSVNPSTNNACARVDCPKTYTQIETEEGPVIVELWKDNMVVVTESFDSETAAKLSAGTRNSAHKAVADNLHQELGMRLYDLPAFRRLQESIFDETLAAIAGQLR